MHIGRCRTLCGYSLVELLVVIGAIALLVAVLAPALNRSREQGRRVVCLAHLHGLANAWEVYAIEYSSPPQLARRGVDINGSCAHPGALPCGWKRISFADYGPAHFDELLHANRDGQVWLSAVHHRHHLFQVSNPPPSGPLPGHWWNWGIIFKSGVVRDPRVFFCPSVRDPDFSWNTPLNPWPPSRATMWRPDRPHAVNHTQASYERRIGLTSVPWDRIALRTVIAHDIAAPNIDSIAHKTGSNAAYRDGHAEFIQSDVFARWWSPTDVYFSNATRLKLLAFSYWMDQGGGQWPVPVP